MAQYAFLESVQPYPGVVYKGDMVDGRIQT